MIHQMLVNLGYDFTSLQADQLTDEEVAGMLLAVYDGLLIHK